MKQLTRKLLSLLALLTIEVIILGFLFVCCLLLFALMADTVFIDRNPGFDNAAFRFAESHTSPAATRAMHFFSFFASADYLLVVPPLVVLVFCFFRQLQWYGLKILLVVFTGTLLNQLLKRAFERPRPVTAMIEQSGLSFPSGHAMIGSAFYGLLMYITWHKVRNPIWRRTIIGFLFVLLLLIGYSRIYLQVHYATDVLAGYAMGMFWLLLSIILLRRLEKKYTLPKSRP